MSDNGLRIVSLTAENIKRISAVEITPDGAPVVVIAGRNGQGKTSVLDAIWFALGGGSAQKGTAKPIRDGADTASVTLDLGEFVVTRTWKGDKTALKVENADGATYRSPQALLDGLVGRLSFDPLAFASLPEREQLATLLDLVDLPFDPAQLDAERRDVFDERTVLGREIKQLTGQLAGLPPIGSGVPDQEVSSADLYAELRAAQDVAADIEQTKTAHENAQVAVDVLREQLVVAEKRLADRAKNVASLPELPDIAAIEDRLAKADETNAAVRAKQQRERVNSQLTERKQTADALTARLAEIDTRKATAIREAAMPIDGLGFDDNGVTYNGVPFKQSSSAEQLRVSLAMAMALNPRIRVIRITDGSLLDSSNMALIEEMAAGRGFQVWIERVDESGKVGVVIEDGQVAS